MNLSPEKQSWLSHKIVEKLWPQKATASSKEILFEAVRQGVQNFLK